MKKNNVEKLRIFMIILQCVLLFFGMAVPARAEDEIEIITDYYINPVYEGIIDESDLQPRRMMLRAANAASGTCTTVDQLVEAIRQEFLNRNESVVIDVNIPKADIPEAEKITDLYKICLKRAVMHNGVPNEGDYMQYQYGGYKINVSFYPSDTVHRGTIRATMKYYTDLSMENEVDGMAAEVLDELEIEGLPDIEKIRRIYTYICSHVDYDYESGEENKLKYTAYSALINGSAVCQGYSNLFYRLCLEAGVDVRIVAGRAGTPEFPGERHAWNIVKLGDYYYNLDATWDSNHDDDYYSYNYFLKNMEDFPSHIRGNTADSQPYDYDSEEFFAEYPMAPVSYIAVSGIMAEPENVTFSRHSDSAFIHVNLLPEDATVQDYSYVLEGTAAGYDQGILIPAENGESVLTFIADDGGYTASVHITTDLKDVGGVSLDQHELTMKSGDTELLRATVIPAEALNKEVVWQSSDPDTVSVDQNGNVTAVSEGSAVITVTTVENSFTDRCIVNVLPVVSDVTLAETRIYLEEGNTGVLHASVYPENAYDRTLVWSSDNEEVASVDQDGEVTALKNGTAMITVSDITRQHTAVCEVIVKEFTFGPWETVREADCENDGLERRICIEDPSIVEERAIPATGHQYEISRWNWTEDFSHAEAELVCTNDSSHAKTENAVITEQRTEPGCENTGLAVYTAQIQLNGETITDTREEVLPAIGHLYDRIQYEWSADEKEVTAQAVCARDPHHTVRETVSVSETYVREPSCTEGGRVLLTARFSDPLFETQTRTKDVEALGHAWKLEAWRWNGMEFAEADFVCEHDASHTLTMPAEITVTVTNPTCTIAGKRTAAALVYNGAASCMDVKEEVIPAPGHDYAEPAYTWSVILDEVTAEAVCRRCGDVVSETVKTTYTVTKEAGCTEDGTAVYEAKFTNALFEKQAKEVEIYATGHSYGEAVYTWSSDNREVTAVKTCRNDSTHEMRETAKTTYVVEKEPGPEEYGRGVYTAAFKNKAFYTQVKTVVIPPTGYQYDKPIYTWNEDNNQVKAEAKCLNGSHDISETVNTTYVIEKNPACTEPGTGVYTAEFENILFERQTKTVQIPAAGHSYEFSEWIWEDMKHAQAVFVCTKDTSHIEKTDAKVTVETADGMRVYTAEVTGPDGRKYTDTKTEELKKMVRLAGSGRYETSIEIAEELKAQMGVEKFESIVVASGSGFADALAGGYLAYKKNAPILITSDKRADMIREYIKKNIAENGTVYILGGPSAVSSTFEEGLDDIHTQRLAGIDRYETNIRILEEAGVTDEEIIVARGNGKNAYADSLSASASKRPILLVNSDQGLNEAQKEYLGTLKTKQYYIAGGTGAVSETVQKQIESYGNVERLAGSTRYETTIRIAEKFCPDAQTVVLAYGGNFPDGLCGGPLAAYLNAPLVLTKSDRNLEYALDYCKEHQIHNGYVLGGEGTQLKPLITDEAAKKILQLDE